MKKMIKNKYFVYTVLYWLFIGLLILYISSLGLCAIGTSDAVAQIYPVMKYTRRLLLNFFESLANGQKFVFPMVDYTIGMGDNTIAALNWHGFGDPLYLLTCLVSEENLPYFYTVFFYLRVYLGGISFLLFVSEHDKEKSKSVYAYVIGALLYSFTGFTLQSNMHTIFTHAMIYIPLMLLGAERSWKGKKKGLLGLSTFFFALSGFFFLYIGSISLAVYVIYRILHEKEKLKNAIRYIISMIIEYAIGLGAASFIFIPAVAGFLASNRAEVRAHYPLFYSLQEIWTMIKNMFLPSYSTEQELSVCTIGIIIAICVLFAKDKKRERITLILLFILVITPYSSWVMAGFADCYERWELVVDLYFAYLAVIYWDELHKLSKVQKISVSIVFLGLCFIGKVEDVIEHQRYSRTLISYAILLFMLVVILPLAKKIKKQMVMKIAMIAMFMISYLTICYNWRVVARDREISVLQEREVVDELLADVEDSAFFRTDNERGFAEPRLGMNISMSQGYPGVMEYVSIENNSYVWVFDKWGISFMTHNVMGLDQRAVLETLCAVKYFVVRSEYDSLAPYGFEYVKSTADGEWSLYENQYALPILYGYDKVIDSEVFAQMNGLEKQNYMLKAASVEEYNGEVPSIEQSDIGNQQMNYQIVDIKNGKLENGMFKLEDGAELTICTKRYAGMENYLFIENRSDAKMSVVIQVKNGYTKYRHLTSNRFVTLGTVKEDVDTEIVLTFSGGVEFKQEELQILACDFEGYEEKISNLKISEEEPVVETNYIHGKICVDENTIVCASVPFSNGWSAYVDGVKVPVYRVNDLFVGFEVSGGTHNVELRYVTPGIRLGISVSLVSILALLFFVVKKRLIDRRSRI